MKTAPRNTGFTLIELLVVIAIIALLSSVVLASLNSARTKARDATRLEDITQIQTALELYYNDHGSYPPSGGAASPNSGWSNSNDSSWATLQSALAPYIPSLPTDPSQSLSNWAGAGAYAFAFYDRGYGCDLQWYMIVYDLENAKGTDPGVTACDTTNFTYGGGGASTAIKTVGVNGH